MGKDRAEPSLEEILGSGVLDTEEADLPEVLDPTEPETAADPFEDMQYQDRVEEDSAKEAEVLLSGFQQRAKAEQKRFKDATSTEFYSVVCFQTEEQKEALLNSLGIKVSGYKHFQKYVPAEKFVRAINKLVREGRELELPDPDITYRETGSDRKLDRLT